MNSFNGVVARSTNCACEIAPLEYGVTASVEMRVSVGAIMTSVRTSAMPVSTVLGGSAAAPIAERTSESTTTMRTNDVDITKIKGATDKIVSAAKTSSGSRSEERSVGK